MLSCSAEEIIAHRHLGASKDQTSTQITDEIKERTGILSRDIKIQQVLNVFLRPHFAFHSSRQIRRMSVAVFVLQSSES